MEIVLDQTYKLTFALRKNYIKIEPKAFQRQLPQACQASRHCDAHGHRKLYGINCINYLTIQICYDWLESLSRIPDLQLVSNSQKCSRHRALRVQCQPAITHIGWMSRIRTASSTRRFSQSKLIVVYNLLNSI